MVVKCILNVFGFFPSSRPTFIEYCCMFQYQPVPASWAVASTLAWVLALRPTPIVLTHDFPCSFFDVRTCFHVHWNLGQTTVRARVFFWYPVEELLHWFQCGKSVHHYLTFFFTFFLGGFQSWKDSSNHHSEDWLNVKSTGNHGFLPLKTWRFAEDLPLFPVPHFRRCSTLKIHW